MTYLLTYLLDEEEKEIEIFVDYCSFYDGIGHYEYWGNKEFDQGNLCVEIQEIAYDKTNLTQEQVDAIELALENNKSYIEEACFEDIKDRKEAAEEAKYDSWKERLI